MVTTERKYDKEVEVIIQKETQNYLKTKLKYNKK